MILLEAMALGTPIVAHSVGGITTVCGSGKYCNLVTHNEIEKLASALINQLSPFPENQKKANMAQEHIQQRYSSTINANNFRKTYITLLTN